MRRLGFVATAALLSIITLTPPQPAIAAGSKILVDPYQRSLRSFEVLNYLPSGAIFVVQTNEPGVAEDEGQSGIPWTIIVLVFVVLFLIVAVIVIGVVVLLIVRKRSKTSAIKSGMESPLRSQTPAGALSGSRAPADSSPPSQAPLEAPAPNTNPSVASEAPTQTPPGIDRSATIDLSQTVAILPDVETGPINYGKITFVSGALAGQSFPVTQQGAFIGRDSSSSQIVIADPRISKKHVWIGVRGGRVVIEDQASRNGTFLNDPKSERITENALAEGDTVILGESDVARFEYGK